MTRLSLCLISLCAAVAAGAAPQLKNAAGDVSGGDDRVAGQNLAMRLRGLEPVENSEIHGKLIIGPEDTGRVVPFLCKVTVTETNWTTDYTMGATTRDGAERLVVVHSTNGPNTYLFSAAPSPESPLPELRVVPPNKADIPLAGSDYSLADLGMEYLFWPAQRKLKDETHFNRSCYVLDSINPQGGDITRVRSYIDKESNGPLKVEAFDADNAPSKIFSLHHSSFRKVNGRWQVEKMEIVNKKTGSHTILKFDLNPNQ